MRELLVVAGVGAILAAVLLYSDATPFPGVAALPPTLGAAAIILAGEGAPTRGSRLLSWRPLVLIGLSSYSLYLWHWPILVFARLALGTQVLDLQIGILAALISIAAGFASWRWIERPFRGRGDMSAGAILRFSVGGAVALVAAALVVLGMHGFPQRLPREQALIAAGAADTNPRRAECIAKPTSKLCHVGPPGKPRFILWGDSHGDALQPGIDSLAVRHKLPGVVATRSYCPPLAKSERVDDPTCERSNAAVMRLIIESPDIKLVLIHGRWPLWETGFGYGDTSDEPVRVEHHAEPLPHGAAVMARALAATVEPLLKAGKQVVIIGAVPELGWHEPLRLFAHARFGSPLGNVPDRVAMAARQHGTNVAIEAIEQRFGVTVLYPTAEFCPAACRLALEGRPLFADNNHISSTAALRIMAPLIERELDQHLEAARR